MYIPYDVDIFNPLRRSSTFGVRYENDAKYSPSTAKRNSFSVKAMASLNCWSTTNGKPPNRSSTPYLSMCQHNQIEQIAKTKFKQIHSSNRSKMKQKHTYTEFSLIFVRTTTKCGSKRALKCSDCRFDAPSVNRIRNQPFGLPYGMPVITIMCPKTKSSRKMISASKK